MRRTNRIILISIMFTLLLLGIGYAAIQNITLTILGFAKIDANQGNFNVKFVEPIEVNNNGYNDVIVNVNKNSDISSEINLKGLSEAGETISVVYPIANESRDLSADLKIKTTNDAPEYITIKSQLAKTSLVPGDETTVEITIEVTKTPITDNIKAKIGVELIAMPVQPGEEGTSEGIKDFDQTPNGLNKFGFYYDRFYCNEEVGLGIISHADYSAEMFELYKVEDYPMLEKDEWFCTNYLGPGENNPADGLANGARVENEGKTIVNPDGTIFTLSDIVPHGIYLNHKYINEDDNGEVQELFYLDDGKTMGSISYDSDGEINNYIVLEEFITPKSNGYLFRIDNQILASLNVTGDLLYGVDDAVLFSLNKKHNYYSNIIKEVTCEDGGIVKYTCKDCNEFYTIEIPILNHKNDNDRNGICDDCGEVIEYTDTSFYLGIWMLVDGDKYEVNPTNVVIPDCYYINLLRYWCTLSSIAENAFDNATNLKSVVIPNSVTKIGKGAFEDCYSLENIYFTGTPEQWEQIVIEEGNEILNNVRINYNYVVPKE